MSEVPAADVHTAEVPAAEVRAVLGAPEPTRVTPLVHNQNQRVTAGI